MQNTPINNDGFGIPEMPLEHYTKQLPSKNVYHDGDSINIDGHCYVIAQLITGGYTLLDAAAPGWMPADLD